LDGDLGRHLRDRLTRDGLLEAAETDDMRAALAALAQRLHDVSANEEPSG
jgi:hypothetical protein